MKNYSYKEIDKRIERETRRDGFIYSIAFISAMAVLHTLVTL